jgi:asparagine synthase (glutamine-hydrolysing)
VAHKEEFFPFRLKDHAERAISDEMFNKRSERWPKETPDTMEAYFMRDIFDSEFLWRLSARSLTALSYRFVPLGDRSANSRSVRITVFVNHFPCLSPYRWIPRKDWGCTADPSGRSVGIHNAAYE